MSVELAIEAPRVDSQAVDRRFYFFMTVWLAALAIAGFAPKSIGILVGSVPVPPPLAHLHAFAMVSWLLLLVAQAGLVNAGRRDLHMRLGLVSVGLVPAILVLGAISTVVAYYGAVKFGAGAIVANVLFLQLRFFIMFPTLMIWALAVRTRDPETHKRVMILTTAALLGAAFGRMTWIPGNNLLVTNDVASSLELVALAPAYIYDFVRFGRLHRAYVIGLALALPWIVATHFVWNTPWWKAAADTLMGVSR